MRLLTHGRGSLKRTVFLICSSFGGGLLSGNKYRGYSLKQRVINRKSCSIFKYEVLRITEVLQFHVSSTSRVLTSSTSLLQSTEHFKYTRRPRELKAKPMIIAYHSPLKLISYANDRRKPSGKIKQ
jgi:hypothetical protein